MPVDPDALKAGVKRLVGIGSTSARVEDVLDELVNAIHTLFGLSGAGFLMVDDENALRSVAASDDAGAALEQTQLETGEGPCVDAFLYDKTILAPDLAHDPRYQKMGPMIAERGVHAVIGVPIHVGDRTVGSLNIYDKKPHEWTSEEQSALETYGQLLGGLLTTALAAEAKGRLAEQLQYALDYRVVIERAVGYLMAQHNIDSVEAFNRLRRASRDKQRRVSDVAEDLVEGRLLL